MKESKGFYELQKESECFTNKNYIDFLGNLSLIEMIIEPNSSLITPLLNEIYGYALINKAFDLDGIISSSKDYRISLYRKISRISDACCSYLEDLYEIGCNHPTVLKYNSIDAAIYIYDNLVEYLSLLVENLSDKDQSIIIDYLEETDGKICEQEDMEMDEIVSEIKNTDDISSMITYLAEHALNVSSRRGLLMDSECDVYVDDNVIFRMNNSRNELFLSYIISQLRNFSVIKNHDKVGEYIDRLELCYRLYKDYHYEFFKDNSIEELYLKKSKKM